MANDEGSDDFLTELELLIAGGGGLPADVMGGFWGGREVDPEGQYGTQKPYYEGNEYESLQTMNTEQLAAFQEALLANGLAREVLPGRLDDQTVRGMTTLMSVANRQATRWQDVLDGVVRAGGVTSSVPDAQPSLKPDYATLAQRVKQTFRRELGRDPDEYEMQQLSGELTGFYALDSEVDQELRSLSTDGQQGQVRNVDPIARFQELFEQRYRNELDFVEDKADAVVQRGAVQAGADVVSQAARSQF